MPQAKYTYCALINADKKHEYHDVMIKNYLRTAAERFQHSPYVSFDFSFQYLVEIGYLHIKVVMSRYTI